MKIAIVGGGLTGLTAGYFLTGNGHEVTIFESSPSVGGLARGFKKSDWGWPLEIFYHHFFTNDYALFNLAKEIGLKDKLIIKRPVTATLLPAPSFRQSRPGPGFPESVLKTDSGLASKTDHPYSNYVIKQLDSPLSLMKFDRLPLTDRLRTGILLGLCKLNPFWQLLEGVTAENFIKYAGGEAGWKTIWEPLLYGKFNKYADRVAASWFWARIKKRTANLGYFEGGFQTLADILAEKITSHGGEIQTNTQIESINPITGKVPKILIKAINQNNEDNNITMQQYNSVLITTPSSIAVRLIKFPENYKKKLLSIPHLHAQTLIVVSEKPILENVYWLNINDRSFPFLAVVAHTNFIDKKHYGGKHLTYFGNYLPDNHPYLKMNKKEIFNTFLPYIKKISPNFKFALRTASYDLFTGYNAQPVHTLRFSRKAPEVKTPIPGIFLTNMDSIYPWDRGTNYAVELGQKAAKMIMGENSG